MLYIYIQYLSFDVHTSHYHYHYYNININTPLSVVFFHRCECEGDTLFNAPF